MTLEITRIICQPEAMRSRDRLACLVRLLAKNSDDEQGEKGSSGGGGGGHGGRENGSYDEDDSND